MILISPILILRILTLAVVSGLPVPHPAPAPKPLPAPGNESDDEPRAWSPSSESTKGDHTVTRYFAVLEMDQQNGMHIIPIDITASCMRETVDGIRQIQPSHEFRSVSLSEVLEKVSKADEDRSEKSGDKSISDKENDDDDDHDESDEEDGEDD